MAVLHEGGVGRGQPDRWALAARLALSECRIIACISEVFVHMTAGC